MDKERKAYVFGFGFGREFDLNRNLKFNTEITHQSIYLGAWKIRPILYRLQTGLDLRLNKRFSLNGGPSFSLFYSKQNEFKSDYQSFDDKGFFRFKVNHNTQAWLGWQGGMSWNYGRL